MRTKEQFEAGRDAARLLQAEAFGQIDGAAFRRLNPHKAREITEAIMRGEAELMAAKYPEAFPSLEAGEGFAERVLGIVRVADGINTWIAGFARGADGAPEIATAVRVGGLARRFCDIPCGVQESLVALARAEIDALLAAGFLDRPFDLAPIDLFREEFAGKYFEREGFGSGFVWFIDFGGDLAYRSREPFSSEIVADPSREVFAARFRVCDPQPDFSNERD